MKLRKNIRMLVMISLILSNVISSPFANKIYANGGAGGSKASIEFKNDAKKDPDEEGVSGGEFKTVILGCGERYTDVLAGSVLANERQCQILLTKTESIDNVTMNEIKRIDPDEIIVLGGPEAVSRNVVNKLKAYKVTRLGGEDRYETAKIIGEQVRKISGNKKAVNLVVGTNFPDAMTISPLAIQNRTPILLTPTDDLEGYTTKALKDWDINKVTIAGRYEAVSQNVEHNLRKYLGISKVDRIGGEDRYETAAEISKKVTEITRNTSKSVVVRGDDFPDALTITSLAALNNSGILLTQTDNLNDFTKNILRLNKTSKVIIGGGLSAVSKQVENEIRKMPSSIERIGGEDRYETAVKISQRFDNIIEQITSSKTASANLDLSDENSPETSVSLGKLFRHEIENNDKATTNKAMTSNENSSNNENKKSFIDYIKELFNINK
ncbi:MAG: cell wall-binding repeat-containing protein [Clostridioides sp.]|jgi:putative cell wall-binding protein|nr:cell wall-binding repeat-containing protein [Clostridioides sp.]